MDKYLVLIHITIFRETIKVEKITKGNVDLKNSIFSYKLFFTKLLLRKFSGVDESVKMVVKEKNVNI
jgi:hypothetical protein